MFKRVLKAGSIQDRNQYTDRRSHYDDIKDTFESLKVANSNERSGQSMENLRKECIGHFVQLKQVQDRLLALDCIKDIIDTITFSETDRFYMVQYEYFLNWYYFELWNYSSRTERRRGFTDAKNKYMDIFILIEDWNVYDKLRSFELWSQLCYEFAEYTDPDSLEIADQILKKSTDELELDKEEAKSLTFSNLFEEANLKRKFRMISDEINNINLNLIRCRAALNPLVKEI